MFRKTLPASALALLIAGAAFAAPPEGENVFEEKLAAVVPTDAQYRWQTMHEVYGFIHFGVNTFTNREWGTGKETPEQFAPPEVDARQWLRAMKSAGMSMVILTAKHHDGFCLWPSRYTEHSVKNSPWKSGKGDVVREVVEAARTEGLAVGLYLSPADLFQIENAAGLYGDGSEYVATAIPTNPATFKTDPLKQREVPAGAPVFQFKTDSYNRYFLNQLYELLTEYGSIDEVWFDGAHPKRKGDQKYTHEDWYKLIRTLQPNAVIFGKGPDVRWVGNERGIARETEWSAIPLPVPAAAYTWDDMTGKNLGERDALRKAPELHWYPAEADVSIRPGWFYHANQDSRVKNADTLMDLYVKSVGRNATFLLNIPPNKDGKFAAPDVAALEEFGRRRKEVYGKNLAAAGVVAAGSLDEKIATSVILDGKYETFWEPKKTPEALEIVLPQPVTFNRVLLQEQIRRGQRVEKFAVDAQINGAWREIAAGTTVGYKRILPVKNVTADRMRVRFESVRLTPAIAEFGVYFDSGKAAGAGISEAAKSGYPKNEVKISALAGNAFAADLGNSRPVAGIAYTPPQTAAAGIIEFYEIFVTNDLANLGTPLKTGRFDNIRNNPIEQIARFDEPAQGRYVILKAAGTLDDKPISGNADIAVLAK